MGFLFSPRPSATVNCIRMLRTGLNAVKRTNKVKGSIHPAVTSEMYGFFVCVWH